MDEENSYEEWRKSWQEKSLKEFYRKRDEKKYLRSKSICKVFLVI